MSQWKNRIIGYEEVAPEDLLANPKNFRRHPKHQQEALQGVMADVGWVQDVIVNHRTGHLVDGHLRVEIAMRNNEPKIPVKYVDLSPEEESLVLATLDPVSALATTDREQLENLLKEVETSSASVKDMLADFAEQEHVENPFEEFGTGGGRGVDYTMRIETPLYEPTGEIPPLAKLTKTEKYERMKEAIEASGLPEQEKEFLRLAATRHIVFDYRNIAEYYAHAEKELQSLMEDSALVIIDFQRAIELGYVNLRDEMLELIDDTKELDDGDEE